MSKLNEPAKFFFESYRNRTGIDFWKRETKVRIGLVYGFVDEGLWGLPSQSHYDVQGDLVSLVARVEAKAHENEILMDSQFAAEIKEDIEKLKALPRKEFLKGMGEAELYGLGPTSIREAA